MMDYVLHMNNKDYVKVIKHFPLKILIFFFFFISGCKTFICLNGKTCMIENGVQVCRCLFNCSSEKNQVREFNEK